MGRRSTANPSLPTHLSTSALRQIQRPREPRWKPPVLRQQFGDGLFLPLEGGASAPLYLDEIGELPADLQPFLLRVLEERLTGLNGPGQFVGRSILQHVAKFHRRRC